MLEVVIGTNHHTMILSQFPLQLLKLISSFLNLRQRLRLSAVCRSLRPVLSNGRMSFVHFALTRRHRLARRLAQDKTGLQGLSQLRLSPRNLQLTASFKDLEAICDTVFESCQPEVLRLRCQPFTLQEIPTEARRRYSVVFWLVFSQRRCIQCA